MYEQIISCIINGALWIGMLWNGALDLWKKKISFIPIILMAATGFIIHIAQGNLLEPKLWYGFFPGVACIVFSLISKGEIGMGDGWMLLGMGALMEYELLFCTCIFGMLLAAVVAGILFIVFHKGRKYSIPFVPFLAAGYLCARWML